MTGVAFPLANCQLLFANGVNIFGSPTALLPIPVISTDREGAKRLSASGEIPRMPALLEADSGSFYRDSVPDTLVRRQSAARAAWGERLVSAWQRIHRRDFSLEMTGPHT